MEASQSPNASHQPTPAELLLDVSRAIQRREHHLRQTQRDLTGPLNKLRTFRDALINCDETPLGFQSISASPEIRDIIDNPPPESGLL